MELTLPPAFVRTQVEMYGEAGQAWVDGLPSLLAEFGDRWEVDVGAPFPNLSYNFVAPGVDRDGNDLVLKAGFPSDSPESLGEMHALEHYGGTGAIRLLACDIGRRVLLLERAMPGTMLVDVPEGEATVVAAHLMRSLHRPPTDASLFGRLANWVAGFGRLRARFDRGTGPLPADMIERAERIGAELLDSVTEEVVLHGDLHHFNILSSDREPWLAIDPKGIVGDPNYDPAPFLANPKLVETSALQRRVDIFVDEGGLDRERLLGWAQVYAAMSAWWTIEDGGSEWQGAIELGRRLQELG